MKQPINKRYLLSKTITTDLISESISDPELRGVFESMEAIIDALEDENQKLREFIPKYKAERDVAEKQVTDLKKKGR